MCEETTLYRFILLFCLVCKLSVCAIHQSPTPVVCLSTVPSLAHWDFPGGHIWILVRCGPGTHVPRHSSEASFLIPPAAWTWTVFAVVIGTDYQQEVRIIPLAFMGGVCIPNAHLLLHTTIVQHVPYFFLSVSWCGNPQEGLLCQMLQLFGMIFWTCEKPKSVKDWFYTGQMNWRHICNCHGPVVLKNKHISHNEMYLKIIFLPSTLGCYSFMPQNHNGITKKKKRFCINIIYYL